jgi:hypothetical protein
MQTQMFVGVMYSALNGLETMCGLEFVLVLFKASRRVYMDIEYKYMNG